MKKIKISSEVAYFVSIALIALAVCFSSSGGLGFSMICAPAYLLSEKLGITFGVAEYIIQAILFVLACLHMHRFKLSYLGAFVTGIIYGAILDLMQGTIPLFDYKGAHTPETFPMGIRVTFMLLGIFFTCCYVAIIMRTYFHAQVYDFFVTKLTRHFNKSFLVWKYIFDFFMLAVSFILTFAFFGEIKGIGIGTICTFVLSSVTITLIGKFLDKFFIFDSKFKKLETFFIDKWLVTTLVYLEKDGCYLMLHRNKKANDLNEGKYLGVGGKLGLKERVRHCAFREVKEETGLTMNKFKKRGVVTFINNDYKEIMHVFTCSDFSGELIECNEGTLSYVKKEEVMSLPLWEGDKEFLPLLINDEKFFRIKLYYSDKKFIKSKRTR